MLLSEINEKYLITLGDYTNDAIKREEIKNIIVSKYLEKGDDLFPFISIYTGFLKNEGFRREVMADLLIIYMTFDERSINIPIDICKEIVESASIEVIGKYGDIIVDDTLRKLCIDHFRQYVYARSFPENIGSRLTKIITRKKRHRKGDYNYD